MIFQIPVMPAGLCLISLQGFPGSSVGKESACNPGDPGSLPALGRSPGAGNGYSLMFWPGEFHGLYSPRGCRESDTTE